MSKYREGFDVRLSSRGIQHNITWHDIDEIEVDGLQVSLDFLRSFGSNEWSGPYWFKRGDGVVLVRVGSAPEDGE